MFAKFGMIVKGVLASAVLVGNTFLGAVAMAETSRASMTVRATVLPECTFMTPNVNFQTFTGKRVEITIQNDQACEAISGRDQPVITFAAGPGWQNNFRRQLFRFHYSHRQVLSLANLERKTGWQPAGLILEKINKILNKLLT